MRQLFTPDRLLGQTGFKVTRIGLGDIADRSVPLEKCVATLRRGLDAGINLVDTAPGYENGYSEEIVGAALCGRRRDEVFVIDKVDHKDKPVAPQVDESLKRLGLDHTDAFLFHGVSEMELWASLSSPGGGMDQLADCVKRGKTRFKGISSHNPDVVCAAIESGRCDVVMFAVGPYCDERYITRALPLARSRGVGTVCFKTFGAGKLLCDTEGYGRTLKTRPRGKLSSGGEDSDDSPVLPHLTVEECVRYTLTIAPDVALLGLSFPNEQDAAFTVARDFVPMTDDELAETRRRGAEAVIGKGNCWWNPI